MDDNRSTRAASRILSIAYAVLLRALVAIGGALAAYGATAMFTTAGLMAPNPLVTAGVAFAVVVAAAMWAKERRVDGVWPALLVIGLPYVLYTFGSFTQAECAPPYRPITSEYSCAPVGTHAIAFVAPILVLLAVVLAWRDARALASRG